MDDGSSHDAFEPKGGTFSTRATQREKALKNEVTISIWLSCGHSQSSCHVHGEMVIRRFKVCGPNMVWWNGHHLHSPYTIPPRTIALSRSRQLQSTNHIHFLHHDSSNQPIISIPCLPRERLRRGKTFSHDIQANSTFDSKSPYPSVCIRANSRTKSPWRHYEVEMIPGRNEVKK